MKAFKGKKDIRQDKEEIYEHPKFYQGLFLI